MLTGTHRQDPVLPGWSPKLLKYLVVLLLIGALVGALIWAVVASALFVGTRYRNMKRGIACSVCDTLDKK